MSRVENFIIREGGGTRFANSLVLGRGVHLNTAAGGVPELSGGAGELLPSGRDDTQPIREALSDAGSSVRLGPGTFKVSGSLVMQAGVSIRGRAAGSTVVAASHAGPVFEVAGDDVRIEDLTVQGPGLSVAGSVGVASAVVAPDPEDLPYPVSVARLRLSGLAVRHLAKGFSLVGTTMEIRGCALESLGSGLEILGDRGITLADTSFTSITGLPMFFGNIQALTCTGLTAISCGGVIYVSSCYGIALRSIHALNCGGGVTVNYTSIAELSAVSLAGCGGGFLIENGASVTLNGCGTVHGQSNPITVRGGSFGGFGTVVNGFYAEMTGGGAPVPPLVRVDGGARGVLFNGIHHRGSGGGGIDVDVASAGGRVLFIQHDFDPARVNSGGNFAQL